MPEYSSPFVDPKSPKPSRRLKTGGETLRQVHFDRGDINGNSKLSGVTPAASNSASYSSSRESQTQCQQRARQEGGVQDFNDDTAKAGRVSPKTSSVKSAAEPPRDTQPESFPQLGAPPYSTLSEGQWHTSLDPTQSVKLPGHPFVGHLPPGCAVTAPGGGPQAFTPPAFVVNSNGTFQTFHPAAASTYFGPQQHHQPTVSSPLLYQPAGHAFTNMADYQNAFQPPAGVNFQPPVPDTTFGPMPHVYVPRFDGAGVAAGGCGFLPAGAQVCPPPFQFLSAPTYSVIVPKTYYVNGYRYYQPSVAGVPFAQQGYVVTQQPTVFPGPMAGGQPTFMINGQQVASPIQPVQAVPVPMGMGGGMAAVGGPVPVVAGNSSGAPEVSGLGRTPAEETIRQLNFAHNNKLFEPQDFKPADDDPSRFYYVREVDGNWTQRNRFTIDHLGDCRWYVTDEGWFYAVRLPS